MAGSTWKWNGGTFLATDPNWTLLSGPGNLVNYPGMSDATIVQSGTVVMPLDAQINGNTIDIGSTSGPPAGLKFTGDSGVNAVNPSLDPAAIVQTTVPGQALPGQALLLSIGNFVNEGRILANGPAGSSLTIDVEPTVSGSNVLSTFLNLGIMTVEAGNSLTITGNPIVSVFGGSGSVLVDGGSMLLATPLSSQYGQPHYTISSSGTLEFTTTGTNAGYINFDGPGTLKLDNPQTFTGTIDGFSLGDTIDLGTVNINHVVYDISGHLSAFNSAGALVFSALANTGLLRGAASADILLPVTGGAAGFINVTEGNGHTLLTGQAPSTWQWMPGNVGDAGSNANWTKLSGPGNWWSIPTGGDTMIGTLGTAIVSPNTMLTHNTVKAGGTSGVAALNFFGGAGPNATSFQRPTVDATSIIESAVPGQTTAETTVLNAGGNFVNEGTILADGPAGSVFTVNITAATSGTSVTPGYFFNPALMQAAAGNTLVINVGSASALFNSNAIVADGGRVVINTDPNAIAGGVAGEAAFYVVRGGGTLETHAAIPFLPGTTSQPGGTTPRYIFGDATLGNTFEIDNLGSFSGGFSGFQAGDTVDLGGSLAISALSFDAGLGLLKLLNNTGTILGSLFLTSNGMVTSATAVPVAQSASIGIIVSTGANGDTILTTDRTTPTTSGLSGAWQSGSSWAGGIVPNGTDFVGIGFNQTNAFTLTTGAAPVTVGALGVYDPSATLAITSNTTVLPNTAVVYAGTMTVAPGVTLLSSSLREFGQSSSIDIANGGTVLLTGRLTTALAPVNGTLAIPVGNTSAVQVNAGTMTVEGALLAGPSGSGNGGSFNIGFDSGGAPAAVIVNNGTVTDTYARLSSDPTSMGLLILSGPNARWTDTLDPNDPNNSRGLMLVGYNDLSANSQTLPRPAPLGAARLVIQNFATMTSQQGGLVANTTDSIGEVVVQTGGLWNMANNGVGFLNVGQFGTGSLSILSGGTVLVGANGTFVSGGVLTPIGGLGLGRQVGAQGTILVSGAGSTMTTFGGMSVGQLGQGVLSILNGGTVTIASGIGVGQTASPTSSGTIIVGGTGNPALLRLSPASTGMSIGNNSRGTLVIASSGLVENNGTNWLTVGLGIGSYGSLLIAGLSAAYRTTSSTAGGLTVGNAGTAVATVGDGGTIILTGTGGVTVGQSLSASGLLTVQSGGTIIDSAGAFIGSNVGAHGTLVVTGSGARFDNTSTTTSLNIGLNGTGVAVVSSGGTLSSQAGINAGANAGGVGTIVVTDAGSAIVNSGTEIRIGGSGTGTLTIGNGGTVRSTAGLTAGANFGSTGTLSVGSSFSGTLVNSGAELRIGSSGFGRLDVSSGSAVLSQAGITAGLNSGGVGVISVGSTSGDSSVITNSGTELKIGASGTGTLNITPFGTVLSQAGITAGLNGGGVGTILVGSFGQLTNTSTADVRIGAGGNGTLLLNGGSLLTTSNLDLGGSGLAPQGGRGLAALSLGAHAQVQGALAVWGGSTLAVNGTAAVEIGTSGSYVAGNVLIESGHTLLGGGLITGSVIDSGVIEASGSHAFRPGTLEITGSITGNGVINLDPAAIMKVDGALSANIGVIYQSGGAQTFIMGGQAPGTITNTITGLDLGDRVGFSNVANITNASIAGNALTVQTNLGNYVLNNVTVAPGANPNVFWYNDTALGAWVVAMAPLFLNWSRGAGTSDLATAGNWLENVIPNAQAQLNFQNSPGILTGTATGLVAFFQGGSWTLQNANLTLAGEPAAPYQPFAMSAASNLTINGGTLNAAGSNTIGSTGTNAATVVAQAGAQVSFQGTSLGSNSGESGTIVVSGIGTTWRNVPSTNPAGYGGFMNAGFNGAGYVTITAGASLINSANDTLGSQSGSYGALTVSNGGFVSDSQLVVGASGTGYVNLTDGTIVAANGFQIALSGQGTMDIGAGGTLLFGGTYNPIGANPGGNGLLSIQNGGVARLISAPASVTAFQITNASGANGQVLVSGTGSLLDLNTHGIAVGNTGNGSLSVSAGGTVNAGVLDSSVASALQAGFQFGSQGAITVTGTHSTLNLQGYTALGHAGVATMTVSDSGGVAITNAPTSGSGFGIGVGFSGNASNVGGSGTVAVTSGGTLSAAGGVAIGGNGVTGQATVDNGGKILSGGVVTVGTATQLNGTIYGGSGSLAIGPNGTLLVTAAQQTSVYEMTVGGQAGNITGSTTLASGTVTVTGPDALLDLGGNPFAVGLYSPGTILVQQGGTIRAGTPNSNLLSSMSLARQADGAVTVTGTGSRLDLTGGSYVGKAGRGTLTVTDHALLSIANDPVTPGVLNIGGGAPNGSNQIWIGGSGLASVTNAGTVQLQGNLSVGLAGATGTLAVSSGGIVNTTGRILVGNSSTLAAGGAIITTSGTTFAGAATLMASAGTIDIGAGGTLISSDTLLTGAAGVSGLVIGIGAGASGVVSVHGAGALMSTGLNRIGVGSASQGAMSVTQGGSVYAGMSGNDGQALYIGGGTAAPGTVTVSDIGSRITAAGGVSVGYQGDGTLLIQNAGLVTADGGVTVGLSGGTHGTVTIANGATLANLSTGTAVVVGAAGSGVLSILSGSTLITNDGIIAGGGGGAGTIIVSGPGSKLIDTSVAADIAVGLIGTGTLIAQNNGTLFTAGHITLGGSLGGPSGGTGFISLTGTTKAQALGQMAIWTGSTLTVDATSGIDIGPSGTYVAGAVLIESGHTLLGAGLINGNVTDKGLVQAANGTLKITGAVQGTGILGINGTGAALQLDGTVSPTLSVQFQTGDSETLLLGQPLNMQASINNFFVGDVISFSPYTNITHSFSAGDLKVFSSGLQIASLHFVGTYQDSDFFVSEAGGNVSITTDVVCFARGTLIATPEGGRPVEELKEGDRVLTHTGAARPIIWVGHGRVLTTRGRRTEATPVIVQKGALAPNVPYKDLHITKAHALYLDGVLIPAEFLVNHRTIRWDDHAQEVEVYHIELDTHDVLIANGAPAESYRDDGNRWMFRNANPFWHQPPKLPYAPVLTGGPVVDAVWQRLLDRAGRRTTVPLTQDPDLHLLVDGRRVDGISTQPGQMRFVLPTAPSSIRIASRAAAPQQLGLARDPRELGVAVQRIAVLLGAHPYIAEADDERLCDGFHGFEPESAARWTNGDAAVPPDLFAGCKASAEIILTTTGSTWYVDDGAACQAA